MRLAQYMRLKELGFLWEIYPEATGIWKIDEQMINEIEMKNHIKEHELNNSEVSMKEIWQRIKTWWYEVCSPDPSFEKEEIKGEVTEESVKISKKKSVKKTNKKKIKED